mgnify:CR=1 FL=1
MQTAFKLSVERAANGKIVHVYFDETHEPMAYEVLIGLSEQDYELISGTPFQQKVWLELRRIPSGQTITYQEMAERVGAPGAQQAVGQALARNPLPVILPCHRVTKKDGTLGGFMGKANRQDIKTTILAYEKSTAGQADLT